jgi:cellulose synthase/poly-beta-1,6-N-acetylglucosamine synthase-like glycosyltransferase
MNLESMLPKRWHRTKWFRPLVAAVILLILIAIAVPLAVLIPKNRSKPSAATVILPLYIYPLDATSWKPVYNA